MTKLRLNRHRAKWAVLTSVASVLLLQLGMNVAIDTVKPEWRDPEYGHRMKDLREQAAANPSQPVVVVLGSFGSGFLLDMIMFTRLKMVCRLLILNRDNAIAMYVSSLVMSQRPIGIRPWYSLPNAPSWLAGSTKPAK